MYILLWSANNDEQDKPTGFVQRLIKALAVSRCEPAPGSAQPAVAYRATVNPQHRLLPVIYGETVSCFVTAIPALQ
jgi:hypothetical protein